MMHAETVVDPRAVEARPVSAADGMQGFAAAQLVQQATGGDLDAFEELIRRLQRRVYGFAYQHLRDSEEAHDLAQEIFVCSSSASRPGKRRLYSSLNRSISVAATFLNAWSIAAPDSSCAESMSRVFGLSVQ